MESLLEININQKMKSDVLQSPIDVHSVTKVEGKSIFSITIYYIVNHLGKHDYSDQINRNRLDPILARRNWNCSTL